MTDSDPADQLIAEARARRPRWRSPAARPAPAWFRGHELDLVEPGERRAVYDAAIAKVGPVPWQQAVTLGLLSAYFAWKGDWAWHWPLIAASAGAAASTMVRRQTIRRLGREALRESPDWPQRLAQGRG